MYNTFLMMLAPRRYMALIVTPRTDDYKEIYVTPVLV